jgi:hypothetical protein
VKLYQTNLSEGKTPRGSGGANLELPVSASPRRFKGVSEAPAARPALRPPPEVCARVYRALSKNRINRLILSALFSVLPKTPGGPSAFREGSCSMFRHAFNWVSSHSLKSRRRRRFRASINHLRFETSFTNPHLLSLILIRTV